MLLALDGVHAHYGKSHILHGVHLTVDAGEIVCLLGRNGVGKSTTLKTIMGLVPPSAGTIAFKGAPIAGLPAYRAARLGLGYVPEERRIFPTITVRENLLMGLKSGGNGTGRTWTLERVYEFFPRLRERMHQRAGTLSGGEQQMLTICRTLMGDPHLVMIDEPTEGLAPMLVRQVADLLVDIARRGVAILLVEQKLTIALEISHRVYVMGHGRVVFEGTPETLRASEAVRKEWLEV